MNDIRDKILELASGFHKEVVSLRQHLHMYPELSFEEHETSKYIQDFLAGQGIPFTTGWGGTGVIGLIEGNGDQTRVLALRADMDALPIQEENDVPYASRHKGVMHACGHDVHTSSLLGAAAILNRLKGELKGQVKLIFQPGEERMPGGASKLIEAGALENPRPGAILGQHVHPQLTAGKAGFCKGMSMASADELRIVITGKGGHAALPHTTADPVMATVEILSALQQIISRKCDPIVPSVLSFGRITSSGGTYNVIPDSVEVLGTFRTFDEEWRYRAHQHLRDIAGKTAEGLGVRCDVEITVGYPSLVNDDDLTGHCYDLAVELLGSSNVVEIKPRMTAEDFAYYSQRIPACFYRLGVTPPEATEVRSIHTPKFDIDNAALHTGPALMAWLAVNYLAGR